MRFLELKLLFPFYITCSQISFRSTAGKLHVTQGKMKKRVEEQGDVQAPMIDWKNKGGAV